MPNQGTAANDQQGEEFTIDQVPVQQQAKPQQYTPIETIDINYEKVKDWLMDRSFLPADYVKQLKQIRAYIKHALKELKDRHQELKDKQPEKEKPVADLLEQIRQDTEKSQTDEATIIDYFYTKKIVEVLEKADEAEGSGFLFGFVGGSKRLKLWKHVLKTYETNCINLAEITGYVIQNVKYEIPSLSSSMYSLRTQLESLDKKEEDWKKSLELIKREFSEACEKLSIHKDKVDRMIEFASSGSSVGVDIEEEIKRAVFDLPNLYEEIIDACRDQTFRKSFEYYENFTSYINKNQAPEAGLTCLKFLLSQIDERPSGTQPSFSLYDYKVYNKEQIPSFDEQKVEAIIKQMKEDKEKEAKQDSAEPEIDFGDFGDDVEIKWDSNVAEDAKELEIKFDDVAQEKELEIDFGDFSSGFNMDSVESNVNDEDNNKAVAEMKSKSFLDPEDIRATFTNNIFQLYAFIHQRYTEVVKNVNSQLNATILSNAPQSITSITKDELNKFKTSTTSLMTTLNNPRFKQLVLIKTSKKYVERLMQSLSQKLEIMSKLRSNLEGLETQRKSLNTSISNQQPAIEKIKKQTKEYQQFLQQSLSDKLSKRVVIFGEINKIL